MSKQDYNITHIQNYWRDRGLVLLPNLSFIGSTGLINETRIDAFKIVSLSEWVIGLSSSGQRDIPNDVVSLLCQKFKDLPDHPKDKQLFCCIAKKGSSVAFIPWGNMICLWSGNECFWLTRKEAQEKLSEWKIHFGLVQKYLSEIKGSPEKFMPGKTPGLISKVKK